MYSAVTANLDLNAVPTCPLTLIPTRDKRLLQYGHKHYTATGLTRNPRERERHTKKDRETGNRISFNCAVSCCVHTSGVAE
jgi:hypothetical protein